jgi:transglutaminase-like putative cysteine protease
VRYRIVHRTAYRYASAVHESFNEVRLQPTSGEGQTCLDFELSIDPPATVVTFRDYYGNAVHDFGVAYLHDHLVIEATSEVVTFAGEAEPLGGPRDSEPDTSPLLAELAADPLVYDDWAEFLSPSVYVALEGASGELARAILAEEPEATAYGFLLRACAYIREHFTYQVGATNVRSTVAELIAGGSGVCQDYAHLLTALCRHVGLPARYVSGYLGGVTQSEASHAWTEAFVPPYGWLGVDPTLGTRCTGRHVQVAVGRDYADVPPLRGTYRGGGEAELEVAVRGEILDEAHVAAARRALGERGRGRLIQYQTLGAAAQLQRLGAMTQTLGTMTQTIGLMTDEFFGMPHQSDEAEVPRQQPQQQQQDVG